MWDQQSILRVMRVPVPKRLLWGIPQAPLQRVLLVVLPKKRNHKTCTRMLASLVTFQTQGMRSLNMATPMPRSLRSMNTTFQKTPFVAEQGVFLRPELMVARRCLRRSLRSGIPKGSLGRTWNKSLSNVDMIQNLYLNMGFYFLCIKFLRVYLDSGMIMYYVFLQ